MQGIFQQFRDQQVRHRELEEDSERLTTLCGTKRTRVRHRVSFFRRPDVLQWVQAVDESLGIFR